MTFASAADLLAHYERVFTTKVTAAIERQSYALLFARDQGVMIGDGEVWFNGVCDDQACQRPIVRIIAVNP